MTFKNGFKQIWHEHRAVGLVLFCAIGLGLIFIFLVPPWQHYDEPGHFEYAWLIANRPVLPKVGDYDQAMRREVAASMMEHDFFEGMNLTPNLLSVDAPVWIGISQTEDLPLYYWLVALPLRLFKTSDITFQLYVGRFVSLLFYLLTILAAYGVMVTLTRSGSPLRWLVPLSIALLPSFVDLMTAVNNDTSAIAIFSLFLWCSVLLIQRGFSFPRLAGLIILAILCLLSKNTALIAVVLAPAVLLLSLVRGRGDWAAVGLIGLTIVIGLGYITTGGEAAFWYRYRTQQAPVRVVNEQEQFGTFALQLTLTPGAMPAELFQIIPPQVANRLRRQTVSLGAWIWADHPQQILSPSVGISDQTITRTIQVGTQPAFYAITVTLTKDANRLRIDLLPIHGAAQTENAIYYSGLVLADGERPVDQPPSFSDTSGSQGTWGGNPFQNLIRNPNGREGWLRFRPQVEKAISKVYPVQASLILPSFLDLKGSWVYYRPAANQLFRTFWAKFGWAHVPLYGSKPYRVLAGISLAGLIGSLLFALLNWRRLPWKVILVLGSAAVGVWGAALVRGIDYLFSGTFLPAARYAYPAIIPTMILLSLGLLELLRLVGRWLRIPVLWQTGLYLLFFVGLDVLSIYSIHTYYR
jgi:hypothetical protein